MKRTAILIVIFLLLMICGQGFAQESQLPQLLGPLPDPAQLLGVIGSPYQENFSFYGASYNTYLFSRPESTESFIQAYAGAAETMGYTVSAGTVEGYSVRQISDGSNGSAAALLFPDYQGYVFLMVPESMEFVLHDTVPENLTPERMVELGNESIANRDYLTAVRYLVKAADMLMRTGGTSGQPVTREPVQAPTEVQRPVGRSETSQIYTVQEGDSCWSIAATYNMELQEFMDANNFTECNILIGDEVIIPGAGVQTPTPTPLPGAQQTYVVEEGDNCWSIAVDKFGVNFELFMSVNNMTECNILIGDEVIIPGTEDQLPTMTPIPLDQYTSGQQIQYVVEMNDSYNDIADKFNTTLLSIQQLNNVNVYTGFPQYGQVLTVAVNLVTPTPTPEPTATPELGTLQP